MSRVILLIILAVAIAALSNFGFISANNCCMFFTSTSACANLSKPMKKLKMNAMKYKRKIIVIFSVFWNKILIKYNS